MNTIVVKTNDVTQTIDQVQVVTQDGKPTIITAMDKVNYEFHDTAIGRAPNHIITKRLKNDLHVSFEEDGEESDLIIEGFYDNPDSALLGVAEDGEYYYYIPDTGETFDYVTQLEIGDAEGQALGGVEYMAVAIPWWIPAAAGIGLVGLITGGSNNNSNDLDNNAPIAGDDTVTPECNTPAEKDLFENDSDADGDTLTIDGFTVDGNSYQPGDTATISGIGTITITPEGILTFTPNDGYEGAVPDVTYTVTDGNGGSDDAVVSFADVPAAPNTPPIAGDDTVTPEYNTPAEKTCLKTTAI
ncbi:Ig-like domain-containing protein [Psychrobacter fjordensis]|uniref:Ig-like domain-containing protein n=1 Tax=Psychrobacter fjordensis TaxID=664424 RepID=UPI00191843DA|nr:Ig-like domain-containing protein [Psychrobacter fjordensis]